MVVKKKLQGQHGELSLRNDDPIYRSIGEGMNGNVGESYTPAHIGSSKLESRLQPHLEPVLQLQPQMNSQGVYDLSNFQRSTINQDLMNRLSLSSSSVNKNGIGYGLEMQPHFSQPQPLQLGLSQLVDETANYGVMDGGNIYDYV